VHLDSIVLGSGNFTRWLIRRRHHDDGGLCDTPAYNTVGK